MSETTQTPSKMDSRLAEILSGKTIDSGMDPARAEYERKKQLLERVRTLREGNLSISNLLRNQDPEYVYIWVFNQPQRIDQFLGMQAELVGKPDKVESNFRRTDGTHVRGDTILMKLRREIAEAYHALREIQASEAVEGAKQEFLDWGEREGVPIRQKRG